MILKVVVIRDRSAKHFKIDKVLIKKTLGLAIIQSRLTHCSCHWSITKQFKKKNFISNKTFQITRWAVSEFS